MSTPSRSEQRNSSGLDTAFMAELDALEKCNDTELKNRLPHMGDSREALALVSPEERRDKISAAMEVRNAERPADFRKKLIENMQKKSAARKDRQADSSAISPLAARYCQVLLYVITVPPNAMLRHSPTRSHLKESISRSILHDFIIYMRLSI